MSDFLRNLIVERVRMNRDSDSWLLDAFYHLIGHGVSGEDAIAALEHFVNDLIAVKTRTRELYDG